MAQARSILGGERGKVLNLQTEKWAAASRFFRHRADPLVGALIFILGFCAFRYAPIQQAGDSRYTMLVAENVLRHGSFALDRYHLPEPDYRLEDVDGHQYYYFPPGTSVLSIPFVALMHLRGVSAVRRDGTYSVAGELVLDAKLAAILMGAFAALSYIIARVLLPVPWSVVVACVSAFGTQVFSTASRSMWSDTWGIVLVGLAAFLLLRGIVRRQPVSVSLVASLESVAYVVRPTNSLVILGTALYFAISGRKYLLEFMATAAGWLVLFVAYSWLHFHKLLPNYFAASRLSFVSPSAALFGNLVSPSRGLLVYVPAIVAIALAMARYRRTIRSPILVALSAFVICGHLFVLSGFVHWWGGHSYGARLTTSLVPWFVVLAVLAVDAFRGADRLRAPGPADIVLAIVAGLLCVASIGINSVGAFSQEASKWNVTPEDIDRAPARLWNWRRPQFLAGFVEPQGAFLPLPSEGLHLGVPEANPYLGLGWAYGEGEMRWTDGPGASTVRFALRTGQAGALELELRPYLGGGKVRAQRLAVSMNDRDLAAYVIKTAEFATYRVVVPADVIKEANVLRLAHPDAVSPAAVEGASDRRELGVAVRRVAWTSTPSSTAP